MIALSRLSSLSLAMVVTLVSAAAVQERAVDPGVYTYIGCYPDSADNRILPEHQGTGFPIMSVEECREWCGGGSGATAWPYFGVEYGSECFCDWKLHYNGPPVANSECNMPCTGNSANICGGANRISIYYDPLTPLPQTAPPIAGWEYKGCYTDSRSSRTIAQRTDNGYSQSPSKCMTACANAGYTYAGVEYSTECYCGNSIGGQGTRVPDSECDMQCYGSFYELCGAGDRINVYHRKGSA